MLHVFSTNTKETTSRQLQDSLIDYCLTKGSWSYNRMAGKLYISILYKDIFNSSVPLSLKETHEKLVSVGLMSDDFKNAFSDEDYVELEKIIDHSKDLTYAHYQIKQIMKKYSLMDRTQNIFYESPQQVYMRVAMRMCQNKGTGKQRLTRIKRHYKMYCDGIVNIPTPYFTNAGTKRSGFLSCNLHTSDDTIGSLSAGDHISYMMTVGSAGQGSKIYTRTIGTPVKGGAIVHSGKINYYRTQVAMINANLQNGRGGAETQYYDCFDPEWKTIQKFKNQMTPLERQVRGLDYSMCFNSFFLNKAARNEDIAVFDYGRFPDLYKAMAEPTSDNFERIYNNCLALGLFETFVNAREILLGALIEALSTGRHYLCNLTEMNRHTPFKEPIVQSNLCIASDQVVPSDKGLLTAEELYKLNIDLVLTDGEKLVHSSPMLLRERSQDVYKITLSNGMSHTVTDYHKIMTDRGLVQCKDLVVNKDKAKVNINEGVFGNNEMEDEAYLLGLWQGDGTRSGEQIHIDVWEDKTVILKEDILDIYSRVRTKYTDNTYELVNQTGRVVGTRSYSTPKFSLCTTVGNKKKWRLSSAVLSKHLNFEKNIIPRWLRESDRKTQLAYVKGVFQTDGSYSNNKGAHYLAISQASKEYLEQLQIMLNNLGYSFSLGLNKKGGIKLLPDSNRNSKEYLCKDSYRLVAGSFYTCLKFEEDTGFISFRGKTLPDPIKSVYLPKEYYKIISVEYVGKDDVYCPTVNTSEHLFVGNCFITRNCGEIKLSTKAYNEIIELYWPRYLEDKETPPVVKEWIQEQVDKTEGETATCALSAISIGKVKNQEVHKEAAWVALDMIHTAITETDYMLPHIKYTSTKRMSAGVGMMDLAHALAKRKLSYDSQEGRNFIHQVSESQYWWLLEASLELSKEFGVAEWMHKTKWTDNNSWLPLDTYNRNVDSLITCGLQHNWDDIRQRIIENGGHAFSVLSSDMPKPLLGI